MGLVDWMIIIAFAMGCAAGYGLGLTSEYCIGVVQ